jgi:hypothetical protein
MFRIQVVVINEINISCFLSGESSLMGSPLQLLGQLTGEGWEGYATTLTITVLYSVD